MHYLFLSLKLSCFSNKTSLGALSFSVDCVLEADIEIELHLTAVFCFKAKPVDDIAFTLLVDVLRSDDLIEFVNSD